MAAGKMQIVPCFGSTERRSCTPGVDVARSAFSPGVAIIIMLPVWLDRPLAPLLPEEPAHSSLEASPNRAKWLLACFPSRSISLYDPCCTVSPRFDLSARRLNLAAEVLHSR